ncbi:MAG: histidine kinase [Tahibacter sp.]
MAAMSRITHLFAPSPRLFWLLQVAGWSGYFALSFLSAIGYGKPVSYVWASAASALVGLVISSALRLGYRAVWSLPTSRMVALATLLLLVATAVYARFYAEFVFRYCMECRPASLLGYLGYFGSTLYVMLSWSGLYFGIKFSREIARERENALKATAAAHEAQLKMLRYQLNPHFLFNTLNAISTLVLDRDNDTANRMVGALSAFLRHSLDSDPMQRVSLGDELGALTRYLSIEQLRFGERLQVEVDVDDEARIALVPSLILQPLIENCIKYAIAKRIEGGTIAVQARVTRGQLRIAVRDDGPGVPTECAGSSNGVGLANTRERLRVLYGEKQSVEIINRQPSGLEVVLSLPYEPDPRGAGA